MKGIKTLIVDDNATNRRTLRGMLEQWGMMCGMAETGEQALQELAEAHRTGSAILTDSYGPLDAGNWMVCSFVKKVRERSEFAATTILILTSAGHRGDASRCHDLGVSAYLVKPVRQSELRASICRAIGGGQPSSERPLITRYSLLGAGEASVSLRVLLAEDNVTNQKLAGRLLEKRGHRVVLAGNGREALKLFEDGTFDLILMDVQMPEMDGLEAVAAIRRVEEMQESRHRTPVIALTAHAMKGDRDRCIAAGMDGYLPSPFARRNWMKS